MKEADQALRDNLRETLNHYFQQMNKSVGESFEKKTDKLVTDFYHKVHQIEQKTSEVQNIRIKTKKIEEVCVSVVQVLLYALIAVLLVTGMKYGLWEVLGLAKLYEKVSQTFEWGWLVMAVIMGGTGLWAFICAFTFVKDKTSQRRF
ncbi:hypothetical protein [Bacillus sp. FSL R12-0069]|uniref:hypothetical protein n=1 Tax=Bacillus sp. FSL R12-0069 TaxID=2975342 RepID=UPI0030F5B402